MFEMLIMLSLETKTLAFVGIHYAIEKTIELCGDLWCDVPMLHQYIAGFLLHFTIKSSLTGVSVDWLLGRCLQSVNKDALDELIDGGFLAAVVGETLKLLKAIDAGKAKKEVIASNSTILSVFPSYKQSPKDMLKWIKVHELEEVLPLEPAFELAKRVSEASSYDEVVLFITKHIPETQRLCGNTDTQVRLVSAIMQTRTDIDEVKKLLKHLVKEGAVLTPALSKWLELNDDNSASRKRVQEELSEFVEDLVHMK
ncbi:eukaryotic translation initiation factor 4 gamma put [Plasmopara halstedii]|uniref:Eukaryotic translation initiation factor 4 gamma put n=1 Tax=Plasmopara halstedii TaxID=4781 RepID=A0A0P1ALG7_PLAHL|nr:eukaryotic translation initiation factor 4 gamma put [Plasmopara halstedii]CEG41801.1 eukaryotic translation initiation factor 4 gamma put [Plasmopara halstedii]|eukprot:XP_024578170.1 eukaryotic translation initiation factor 4 gamma put [Plasmopara halstedii]